MKLWIRSNRDVVFKVTLGGKSNNLPDINNKRSKIKEEDFICYALIKGNNFPGINNKRLKIKVEDTICFASFLSYDFPPDFIAMYYSENIKYCHELRELIKAVCY